MSAWRAVYRLQLGPGLDFAGAAALVPFLRDLGVSHLYLSPSLQARAGSTHGYDVVDPTRLSDALGGEEGFRSLAATARDAGLGILLDVVPNHMGIGDENRWWVDPESRAMFFDLDPATGRHRRFFDIDELAGLRQEDPYVFATTHAKVLSLVRDGLVDGLRIDHPDGLADPAGYLRRLRAEGVEHVWVEKILETDEALRDWPVEGTVGYEFLNDAAALFVDPAGEDVLSALWAEVSGSPAPFASVARAARLEQARTTFVPELDRLRALADLPGIEDALSAMPVYRTYVEPWSGLVTDADREAVATAGIDGTLADALLLVRSEDGAANDDRSGAPATGANRPDLAPVPDEYVTRFQQTSGPIVAKGTEDTAFYRYARLLAHNDVGGNPDRFSLSVAGFHARVLARAARFPRMLLTTQTHDTKRSGDVRARIGALAGMAAEWCDAVARWEALTAELRTGLAGEPAPAAGPSATASPPDDAPAALREAPSAVERYLIYQTLVGAWPISLDRLSGYLTKALREAKVNSTWTKPDTAWEDAVQRFAAGLCEHAAFRADFEPFAARVAAAGRHAALGQLLLKLTVPGVTDLYQGDELEALSLVDPDNRRPVDWDARRAALVALRAGKPVTDATRKLHLIRTALALRARRPDAFDADYTPLDAGPDTIAFARGTDVIALAPLRAAPGPGDDATLTIPPALAGRWRNALTADDHDHDHDLAVGPTPAAPLVAAHGVGLLERVN